MKTTTILKRRNNCSGSKPIYLSALCEISVKSVKFLRDLAKDRKADTSPPLYNIVEIYHTLFGAFQGI